MKVRPEGLETPTDRICTTLSDGTARSLRIPYPAKVITPNRSKEFTTIQERLRIPLRQRCGQREDSAPPDQCSSNQEHRGKTLSSNPSTANSATSCSRSRCSIPCWRPKLWPRTTASRTTPTGPTPPSATGHQTKDSLPSVGTAHQTSATWLCWILLAFGSLILAVRSSAVSAWFAVALGTALAGAALYAKVSRSRTAMFNAILGLVVF